MFVYGVGVEVRNVLKFFGVDGVKVMVFDDVSFMIGMGEFVLVIGFSGCGKFMLFKVVVGFFDVDFGSVMIDGESVRVVLCDKKIGFVLQLLVLLLWKMVCENVEFFVWINCGVNGDCVFCDLVELLLIFGFGYVLKKYFGQFFGGMQQCVVIVRVFVFDLVIMLMDELFFVFDEMNCDFQCIVLLDFWQLNCKVVMFVMYLVLEVIMFFDCIVVMVVYFGCIVQVIDVNLL